MNSIWKIAAMAGATALMLSAAFSAYGQEDTDAVPEMDPLPPAEVADAEATAVARPNLANHGSFEAFVDGIVAAYSEKDDIAGVLVSVVKDGQVVLAKGYGLASVEPEVPVTEDETLFRVGSISKTFIWTALMQLEEQGKLSIDDPANDYLPEALQIPDEGFAEPIRIRHLMTHSPGFEDTALGHLFALKAGDNPPLAEYLAKYRPHRVRPAGDAASYSNYGAGLAGVIVAEVSGMDFESYVDANIFAPLGMTNSTFREPYDADAMPGFPAPMPEELAAKMSGGFKRTGGTWEDQGFEYIGHLAPAGSMSSTATDMARFMMAHLNDGELEGARILETETAQRMHQTLRTEAEGLAGMARGLIEYRLPGNILAYGHSGDTLWFHSDMVMVPEYGFGVFVSTNSENGGSLRSALTGRLIARYFAGKVDHPVPPEDFAERGQKYAGAYMANRRSYTGLEGILSALNPPLAVSVNEDGYLLMTAGPNTTRWVEIGPNLFQKADGPDRIGFRENEAGEITHLYYLMGVIVFERVGFFGGNQWFMMIFALSVLTVIGVVNGAWLRRKRNTPQSGLEALASGGLITSGLLWLGVFILLGIAGVQMAAMGGKAFFTFPIPMLVATLVVILPAAALSVVNIAGLYAVWKERNWPVWRRIRHTLAVLVFAAFALTLNYWNAVGFNYF